MKQGVTYEKENPLAGKKVEEKKGRLTVVRQETRVVRAVQADIRGRVTWIL